ncbi:ras guanine nucleotide exchange factor domain-containing protein [Lentinula edodes]|nr:ras guanine nucleotide exchange factor domain-containing protein [Lentinula edodes]
MIVSFRLPPALTLIIVSSHQALTPKIKGSGPPTPAKPNKISNKISSKAAKILGEEAPPWFLLPDEGKGPQETGLVVDPEDKSVKGGSVKALVERLTAHDTTDPNYSKAFLMTFKSFTTLNDLFDLLVERFRIQPPSGLATLQLRQWTSRKRNIVQFRVINTFKSMLTDEDILEKDDLYILARMKEFVLSEDVAQVSASRSLLALIERVVGNTASCRIVVKAAQTAPAPLLPKAKRLKLTDIEPLELARQLTLLESALYQKIRPMECLQRAREGVGAKDKDGGSGGGMDNIAYVIQTSNRIADWVAESVLSKEDSRKRAATVKHLILVADRCRTLNNFSTMIAIVSGLNTPPIRRLKRTWELVSQRHMAQFGACEVTLDSNRNFNKYRSMLASVVPPCVPFIGVFLSTLQFIQDGNKDLLSDGVVNFKKRQMASEVISDIKRWQAHTYNLQVVPAIRDYIEECLSAYDETDTRMSSDRFWQMSLEREPREREDEKMARLLQESGFL